MLKINTTYIKFDESTPEGLLLENSDHKYDQNSVGELSQSLSQPSSNRNDPDWAESNP